MKVKSKNIKVIKNNDIKIYEFTNSATVDDVHEYILDMFQEEVDLVKKLNKAKKINIWVNIKNANFDVKVSALRTALKDDNLVDPLFINNLMLLVKKSNTYTDDFFNDENIFFSDKAEYIDIKTALEKELEEFSTKICIFLVSILKYYHRTLSVNLDVSKPMPLMYKAIFLSYDLMTLLMTFNKAKSFNTDECVYFKDSAVILNQILSKFTVSYTFMDEFLKNTPKDKFGVFNKILKWFHK